MFNISQFSFNKTPYGFTWVANWPIFDRHGHKLHLIVYTTTAGRNPTYTALPGYKKPVVISKLLLITGRFRELNDIGVRISTLRRFIDILFVHPIVGLFPRILGK